MEQCDFWLLCDGIERCNLIDSGCACNGSDAHCALRGQRVSDVMRQEEEITLREVAAHHRRRRNLREAS